jgi:hypothetical protein
VLPAGSTQLKGERILDDSFSFGCLVAAPMSYLHRVDTARGLPVSRPPASRMSFVADLRSRRDVVNQPDH